MGGVSVCFSTRVTLGAFIRESCQSDSQGPEFAVNAFRGVEQAIGEHMDRSPLNNPHAGKSAIAVVCGRKGGIQGEKRGLSPCLLVIESGFLEKRQLPGGRWRIPISANRKKLRNQPPIDFHTFACFQK